MKKLVLALAIAAAVSSCEPAHYSVGVQSAPQDYEIYYQKPGYIYHPTRHYWYYQKPHRGRTVWVPGNYHYNGKVKVWVNGHWK